MQNLQLNFLIIGSAKAGSNSLHRYVQAHPDIFMPKGVGVWEEINLFLNPGDQTIKGLTNDVLRQNRGDGDILREIFQLYEDQKLSGIRSTDYSKAPFRDVNFGAIKIHNPDMKFLFAIRHPYEKLLSQYRHFQRNRPQFTNQNFVQEVLGFEYYQYASAYAYQAERYFAQIDRKNFHFVITEHMEKKPQKVLNEVYEFLGVDANKLPKNLKKQKFNVGVSSDSLTANDIPENIKDFIRADVERLQQYVGVDLKKVWKL